MYIVTGGVGFIGTCIVQELNRQGIEDIIIVDRLDDSVKWKNLREIKFTDYINADEFIEMISTISNFSSKIKGIIHLGACSSTTEMDMEFLMDNNVNYSKDIFNFCTENEIPLLYASSAATYGDGKKGYDDSHNLLDELRPLNPYGLSKHLFDLWVLKQKQVPNKWFGIKFFNVFGPHEYHKGDMRSVVHKSYGQIKKDGVVRLFKSHKDGFKDGEQLRDFIYGVDAAKACVEMLIKGDGQKSGIYNLGTGKARSFKELVTATFKSMDAPVNIEYFDMPEHIRDQYQYFTEAKMDKFFSLLPDFKFHSLEDGVQDYIKNYL